MRFEEIRPFVRYVHYLPLDRDARYAFTVPMDARLFYCCSGEGSVLVGETEYPMVSGCVLVVPSGMGYRIGTPAREVTYLAVNFDYTQEHLDQKAPIPPVEQPLYDPGRRLENILFQDAPDFNSVVYLCGAENLLPRLMKLEREYFQKLIYFERLNSDVMGEVLFECARKLSSQRFRAGDEAVTRVVGYIQENYMRPLTNRMIGERFHLHPNHVSSMVKTFTGVPLHRYVLQVRISHALEMLQESDRPVGEIAAACGFCDIYHFSKCFKQALGVTPSRYRVGKTAEK